MSAQADTRRVGAAPHVVFEDVHLWVMFQPGGSDMYDVIRADGVSLQDRR